MTSILKPFWFLSQKLAPKLDAMHRGWSLEAQSFFVVALKGGKDKDRYCPICEKYSKTFSSFGYKLREDAKCDNCGSLERDRLTWLYIKKNTNFFQTSKKKMFHVAPEPIFQNIFQKYLKENYLSVDLYNKKVMVNMDITNITYEDNSFDYVYCSHVLEHILDDRKAMRELHRILKADGWAILNVPIVTDNITEEDSSITTTEDRMKHYGHPDHIRNYGIDYKERLEECGWNVEVIFPKDFLSEDEILNMGITLASGEIYLCRK